MPVTMREVADLAGVSPRTVSNVVNDFALVSDETRARVQRAIEELGYRPNPVARSLRNGRSGFLLLAVPELDIPYFAELASLVIAQARRCGYTVIIEQTDGQAAREEQLLERDARNPFVDGLIFSPLSLTKDQLRGSSSEVPVVLLGEHVTGGAHDHVGIDNVAAARLAVEHLVEIGRTRIAAIGHQVELSKETGQYRTMGYRQALEAAGRAFDPALVASTDSYHRDSGAGAMAELLSLDDPPDAVFCYNDLLALGAIRMCADRGLDVPGDVAVVGFDDSEDCRYRTPSLTTIAPDKAEIAEAAVTQLLRRLNHDESSPTNYDAQFHLEIRESTGRGSGDRGRRDEKHPPHDR